MTGASPHDTPRAAWTEERDAELKRLRANGLSMSQIARELGGVTRNAVIGRLHRLGVKGPARPKVPSGPPCRLGRPKVRVKDNSGFNRLRRLPEEMLTTAGVYDRRYRQRLNEAALAAFAPVPGGVDMMDLTNSTCRWPVHADGEPARFCGAGGADLAAERPYCACHARLAIRRPATAGQIAHGKVIGKLHAQKNFDAHEQKLRGQNAIRWRQGRGTTRYAAE